MKKTKITKTKTEEEFMIETGENDTTEPQISIDDTFYSNAFKVSSTENDAYIEFMQLPHQNGIIPAVRIYVSSESLEKLTSLLVDVQKKRVNQ